MKKKLQLNKEIVSILDRNRMRQLTKAGGYDPTNNCDSRPCIIHSDGLCLDTEDKAICAASIDHDMCTASVGDLCPTMLVTACDCPAQTQEEDGCIIAKTMDDDCKTQRLCPLTAAC